MPPKSELVRLREKCLDQQRKIDESSESESALKLTNVSLERDIKSLKKQLQTAEGKLLKHSAYGAVSSANSAQNESKIKELTIKLSGAKEEVAEAKKEARKYETLYKEAKTLYAEQNRKSIMKLTPEGRTIEKIGLIMAPSQFIASPPKKKAKLAVKDWENKIKAVKTSVLSNLDRLGVGYSQINTRVKSESKLVVFRQVYETKSDGSLRLVSSTPVVKAEPVVDPDVITLDSD